MRGAVNNFTIIIYLALISLNCVGTVAMTFQSVISILAHLSSSFLISNRYLLTCSYFLTSDRYLLMCPFVYLGSEIDLHDYACEPCELVRPLSWLWFNTFMNKSDGQKKAFSFFT